MLTRETGTEPIAPHVTPEKYRLVREAILSAMPPGGPRFTPSDLAETVAPALLRRHELFPHMGSVRWFCASVQHDLEMRGLIERVPGVTPTRLRRKQS